MSDAANRSKPDCPARKGLFSVAPSLQEKMTGFLRHEWSATPQFSVQAEWVGGEGKAPNAVGASATRIGNAAIAGKPPNATTLHETVIRE